MHNLEKIQNEEKSIEAGKKNLVSAELITNAENSLLDFLKLKPEEKTLFLSDEKTNKETLSILKSAVSKIGSSLQEFVLDKKTKRKEFKKILKQYENQVIIDLSVDSCDASSEFLDKDLEKYKYRALALYDIAPEVFKNGGAATERIDDLEYRLNKMEATLKETAGFKITSRYGTNLELGLRQFKERRWDKETGIIDKPGKWGNLPIGEIYTTPDERTVNGELALPVLESTISTDQGVDEFVKLTIKDGVIISIQGGKSAETLKKKFQNAMREAKKEKENLFNPLRIAEIGFGANSKARSTVADAEQPYNYPGISVVEAEKRFGTIHLAFGDSKHGEEGVEGFESAPNHYDFVIPRNGLTVEIFTDEKDFKNKKNGRKIISDGGINFF